MIEQMRVDDPEGDRQSRLALHDDIGEDGIRDRRDELLTVDRIRPGLEIIPGEAATTGIAVLRRPCRAPLLAIKRLHRREFVEHGISGYRVCGKLSALAEEYRSDNFPITFRNRLPDGKIDVANDPRIFAGQVRLLELSPTRIQGVARNG